MDTMTNGSHALEIRRDGSQEPRPHPGSRGADIDEVVFPGVRELWVTAHFIAERIDTRRLAAADTPVTAPVTQRFGERGIAMIFRYGAVVTFEPHLGNKTGIPREIDGCLSGAFADPDSERTTIIIDPERQERVGSDGVISLHAATLGRLLVVAEILGKSIALTHHEDQVRTVLERADPLADRIRRGSAFMSAHRELLRLLGSSTLTQLRTVGRVEIRDKPEITWEQPELDRLYERLRRGYELAERDGVLTQKLQHITQTTNMFVTLIQSRRTHRVEWYIVALIVVEIVILLAEMFLLG